MLNKIARLIVIVFVITLLNYPLFADDTLIVPGERIGTFIPGEMSLVNVKESLGKPDREGQTCMGIIIQYNSAGLRFYFDPKTKKLNRIRTLNHQYHTDSGLAPGSDIAKAMQEFSCKKISNKGILDCEQSGITFYYDLTSEMITSISINSL